MKVSIQELRAEFLGLLVYRYTEGQLTPSPEQIRTALAEGRSLLHAFDHVVTHAHPHQASPVEYLDPADPTDMEENKHSAPELTPRPRQVSRSWLLRVLRRILRTVGLMRP